MLLARNLAVCDRMGMMKTEKNIKRRHSKQKGPSDETLSLFVVVPFLSGCILMAYSEYVPAHMRLMRDAGGVLAILGVCAFFGMNGIVMVWLRQPR